MGRHFGVRKWNFFYWIEIRLRMFLQKYPQFPNLPSRDTPPFRSSCRALLDPLLDPAISPLSGSAAVSLQKSETELGTLYAHSGTIAFLIEPLLSSNTSSDLLPPIRRPMPSWALAEGLRRVTGPVDQSCTGCSFFASSLSPGIPNSTRTIAIESRTCPPLIY